MHMTLLIFGGHVYILPFLRCLSFFVFCCLCLCNVISIAYTGFCTDKIIKSDFFCLQKGSGWPSGVVSPRDTMFIVHSEQSHQFPSLALATSSPSSTFKPICFTCHQSYNPKDIMSIAENNIHWGGPSHYRRLRCLILRIVQNFVNCLHWVAAKILQYCSASSSD